MKTGIVHFGVGGFHRSHQAYYVHQLLEKYDLLEWGICGVGLREEDRKMNHILRKQDFLYTLMIQHPNGTVNSEVIGSLKNFLLGMDTPSLVIEKMSHPDTKIVSLTITEGGYNFNPSNGEFNFTNPDVQFDLEHRDKPKTVFGFLTAALDKRRSSGIPAFSVLSCDNIQHNGDVARKMLLAFARKQDLELANWIAEHVSFPNTMVDRITPATTIEDMNFLASTYKLRDEWPVVCEPFIQWVVEDNFSNGRPPLEKLDVQFVDDVSPFEKMKIRLLNAGHSVLGIAGAVHGHSTIFSCMSDPVFAKFMRHFFDKEVSPVLGNIEGMNLGEYKDSLGVRFANPNIKDNVARICSESSAKLPKFLIPTLQENLAIGGSIDYATFILAAWCYYCDVGVNENNEPIEIIDENKNALHLAASTDRNGKLTFLQQPKIFGELADNQRFRSVFAEKIKLIYSKRNVRALMNEMI
jgi:mannitol 2-dehydrogenase